jgi:hypothetical protein
MAPRQLLHLATGLPLVEAAGVPQHALGLLDGLAVGQRYYRGQGGVAWKRKETADVPGSCRAGVYGEEKKRNAEERPDDVPGRFGRLGDPF